MLRMLNPTQRTTTRRMKLSRKWKDDFVRHMLCVRLHVFVFFLSRLLFFFYSSVCCCRCYFYVISA